MLSQTSPRKAVWQVLKEPQLAHPILDELYRRSPQIATPAANAREFCRIIRERDAAAWPQWKHIAAAGPLACFAKRLCHDEATFLAALQRTWSNELVESHAHRLKLIKRSMYSRASFDLLLLRVFHAA